MTQTAEQTRVLVHALDQTGDVLDHVHADDLTRPTPCGDWDVSALVDHLMATPVNFLTMVQGGQPDWGAAPPHLTHSWGPEFRVHADDLVHAWHERGDDAPVATGMVIAELAVHTWDLARAIDFPLERLDPEVAETGLSFLQANLKPEMRGDAFGPEQTAPEGAGPYERLAAFAGRQL
ncbi:MAG TPA: TIGR03086 family metal-binding protein [Mycobacteriales bacterium]|nr:TIGR03086 family metal-binding protein [Mycobacteriales bacterium]